MTNMCYTWSKKGFKIIMCFISFFKHSLMMMVENAINKILILRKYFFLKSTKAKYMEKM